MQLYIKNMVCDRCISAVQGILQQLHIPYSAVELGVAHLITDDSDTGAADIDSSKLDSLQAALQAIGFTLVHDRHTQWVTSIKALLVQMVANAEDVDSKVKFSDHISAHLPHDYRYLSSIFSAETGSTIEQYYLKLKIERAKELLLANQLTLSQIADLLGYSSVAHLSTQFKKIIGLTPSNFKSQSPARIPLDKI